MKRVDALGCLLSYKAAYTAEFHLAVEALTQCFAHGFLVLWRIISGVPLPSFRFFGVLMQRQFYRVVDQHKGQALVIRVLKRDMVQGIKFDLVADLHAALTELTEETDRLLNYLAEGHPEKPSRDELVRDAQAWRIAFTDEGKRFASTHSCREETVGGYVKWLGQNYSFAFRNDPVPGWKERLASFGRERDPHAALRKYQEFVNQTQSVREAVEASVASLDAEIDRQIDAAREGRV